MQLVSLNVGRPATQIYHTHEVLTGGLKRPISEAMLRFTNLDGDLQADQKHHGGPDKAVCVYSFDHYPFWETTLGRKLDPGAFSENFTLSGVREPEVCIGDIFRIGEAMVQISQPRVPCSKLTGKLAYKPAADLIHDNSYSGFYLRVLQEGLVRVGDEMTLTERHPLGVTIEFANQVMYHHRDDAESLRRLLAVPELAREWRVPLTRRLTKTDAD